MEPESSDWWLHRIVRPSRVRMVHMGNNCVLGPITLAAQSTLLVTASFAAQAPFALSMAIPVGIGNLIGEGKAQPPPHLLFWLPPRWSLDWVDRWADVLFHRDGVDRDCAS